MDIQGIEAAYLEVKEKGGRLCLVWRDATGKRPIPCAIDSVKLPALRRWVGEELQQIKNSLGKALQPYSTKKAKSALHHLMEVGLSLADQIFGDGFPLIQQRFEALHPRWNESERVVPVVTVVASLDKTLPLELLPAFGPRNLGPVDLTNWSGGSARDEYLRRFLGFSVILKRVISNEGEPRTGVFKNDPRLPIKVFVESTLPGVRKEIDYFTKTAATWIDAEIWPEKGLRGTVCDLVKSVWHCNQRTGASQQHLSDQIHHFACHCNTEDKHSPKHYLILGRARGKTFRASIKAITASRATLNRSDLPSADSRPFVFLNACSSSLVDPSGATSFPDLFLRRFHCRGFVGSETTVSDAVAAEFSKTFYTCLLKGAPLGEAFHNARWSLARDFGNPLGLFYTCYADTEMSVVNPVNC
jgi:hypothetical protein